MINSVRQVDSKINELQQQGKKIDNLIITFHGMQKRRIVNKGDDYYRHCYETFCLITNNLKHIKPEQCMMSFQSRFGSEEWITPYTEDVVKKLITDGKKEIAIYSPSFVADCLETTDELGHELVNEAKDWGGNIYPIECLNTKEDWCKDFAKYTFTQAEGSAQDKEDIEYKLDIWSKKTGFSIDNYDYYRIFSLLKFSVIMIRVAKKLVFNNIMPLESDFYKNNYISNFLKSEFKTKVNL